VFRARNKKKERRKVSKSIPGSEKFTTGGKSSDKIGIGRGEEGDQNQPNAGHRPLIDRPEGGLQTIILRARKNAPKGKGRGLHV